MDVSTIQMKEICYDRQTQTTKKGLIYSVLFAILTGSASLIVDRVIIPCNIGQTLDQKDVKFYEKYMERTNLFAHMRLCHR